MSGIELRDIKSGTKRGDIEELGVIFPGGATGCAHRYALPGRPFCMRAAQPDGKVWYFELEIDPDGKISSRDVTDEVERVALRNLFFAGARKIAEACEEHAGDALAYARGPHAAPALVAVGGVKVARFGDDRGTPERARHGTLTRVVTAVPGRNRARAARAVDTLETLRRNGTIGAGQANAGRMFQSWFYTARLHGLRASPLVLEPGLGTAHNRLDRLNLTEAVLNARKQVADAIGSMGGFDSPCGLAAWHVLGEGVTIQDWAVSCRFGKGRALDRKAAVGVVIGALGVLEAIHLRQNRQAASSG